MNLTDLLGKEIFYPGPAWTPEVYRGGYSPFMAPGDLYQNHFGKWYIVKTKDDLRVLTPDEVERWIVRGLGLTQNLIPAQTTPGTSRYLTSVEFGEKVSRS